ncbi:hypothetical protein CI238_03928 [Colletotrichum incanum]|uniref:Uncharacterized protein n=1 Tax=Colletotrichum incanum TaxID=1573173 RepID=A0A162PQP2_COLIC|nr:hypothetical protein CI238_03928 [Colletotrichum incanum]
MFALAGVGYVHRLPEIARKSTDSFTMLHEENLHLAFCEAIVAGGPGSGEDCAVICTLKMKNKQNTNASAGNKNATVTNWLDNPLNSSSSANGAVKVIADVGAALRAV